MPSYHCIFILIRCRLSLHCVSCALKSFIDVVLEFWLDLERNAIAPHTLQSSGLTTLLVGGYNFYHQSNNIYTLHPGTRTVIMDSPTRHIAGLTGLPMEILLDIYGHLDISSIYDLALVSRFFHELLTHRKATILLPALVRGFSPFDELLQVYTASAEDLSSTHGGMYMSRRVVFKRFVGDSGIVLASGSSASDQPQGSFTQVLTGRKPGGPVPSGTRTVTLTERDLGPLLNHCQLVRKWEELFPSMRWFYEAASCRSLRPHEKERFRRAFYRWWLYGIYFHEDLPRPRIGLPEPLVDDIRTSQMRHHSTSELLELMDLVETMKDVILHYICPRLDPNQQNVS